MNDRAALGQAQERSKFSFFGWSAYWPTLCSGRMSALVEQYASHLAPVYIRMARVEPADVIRRPQLKGLKAHRKAGICGVACLVAQTS